LEINKIADTLAPVPKRLELFGSAGVSCHVGLTAPLGSDTDQPNLGPPPIPARDGCFPPLFPIEEVAINKAVVAWEGDTKHHRSPQQWRSRR
jgi:hypothetical protein